MQLLQPNPDPVCWYVCRRSPRQPQCYMCFDDEDTVDNPLVAPCHCKGGTRYVHLDCLQRWQSSTTEEKVRGPSHFLSRAEKNIFC